MHNQKGEKNMKTSRLFHYTSVALIVILLFTVGPVQGQGLATASEPDPAGPAFALAQPPYTMNYQGYLTDSGGSPLNGAYDMVFRLYDAASGGTMEWGPESHKDVLVNDGLFQVTLGSNVALYPRYFDEALYLEVQVEGTTLTPRQPLRAVPYAFGLVPGAEVEGDPEPAGADYALYVENTGTSFYDTGIYAQGHKYGVHAYGITDAGLYASSSAGTYAIKSEDAIYSAEGYAGPDTYVWVPVYGAKIDSDDLPSGFDYANLEFDANGEVRVEAGADAGALTQVDVYIPIQVEVPYGREYLITKARVYYMVDDSASIEDVRLQGRDFATGDSVPMGYNSTGGTSTTFAYEEVTAYSTYYTVTTTMAPTNVRVRVNLPNTASTLYIYGVRLQLDSSYD
jgi:hypothetical protein